MVQGNLKSWIKTVTILLCSPDQIRNLFRIPFPKTGNRCGLIDVKKGLLMNIPGGGEPPPEEEVFIEIDLAVEDQGFDFTAGCV